MKLYVNGVLAGSHPYLVSFGSLTNLAANKNFIGRDTYFAARPTTGRIDELAVWKTQRTAQEIHSDMLTKLTGREAGLAGLWTFDDPADPGKEFLHERKRRPNHRPGANSAMATQSGYLAGMCFDIQDGPGGAISSARLL